MKKICTKCKENRLLEEFYREVRGKNGRRSRCKNCDNTRIKKYRIKYKQEIAEQRKIHYIENKESLLKYQQEYQTKNKQKVLECYRKYYANNKEKKLEYLVEYRRTDKGKLAVVRANHNKKNWQSNTINNLTIKESNIILFLQEYKCIYPKCDKYFDEKIPTFDHIKPLSKGGPLAKENVQFLCQSCNSKKHTQEIDYRSQIHKEVINQFAIS